MIRLFINTYVDSDEARRAELVQCLYHNESNAHIDHVHVLSGRPTYNDYFKATELSSPDDINIIANSDIFFKELPPEWFISLTRTTCYALTRWDVLPDGTEQFYNNTGSQDAWIFRGPVRPVRGADFTQGVAGCDNKIAYLLKKAGYRVSNPSLTIKSYHLHNSGVRHYGEDQATMYRLPRPRINVPISKLP